MQFDGKTITSDKVINELDKFVIDFINILEQHTDYVIVSGYVSIILGRSRGTEDVDLLVKPIELEQFKELWEHLDKEGFECVNTSDIEDAFKQWDEYAIRFARKNKAVPNMEFKKMKKDIDNYSSDNKIQIKLNEKTLFLSPLEMQIAYKLLLSTEEGDKDIEDARHIYKLFKDSINKEELQELANKLEVQDKLEWLE